MNRKNVAESIKISIVTKIEILLAKTNINKPITYIGHYTNFEEAREFHSINSTYLEPLMVASEIERINALIGGNNFLYEGSYRDRDLLLVLATMKKECISILDIGCGFGLTYLYLKRNFQRAISYNAIDLKEVTQILQEKFQHFQDFHVSNIFDLPKPGFDIIYFGSSLQYFERYKEIIERACRSWPTTIMIADTPMGKNSSFVTAQVNMRDRIIPRWVFSKNEICDLFLSLGYTLSAETLVDWHQSIHNFDNFPEEFHDIRNVNLIFSRT